MAVESIVSDIAAAFLERLASKAYQEISSAWGIEGELEKLEKILTTVKAVLSDAEKRQTNDDHIRVWLADLKDALYDAEDVLDELEYEIHATQALQLPGSTARKVRRFFSSSNPLVFRFRMAHNIKHVRQKFDDIAARKNSFHLIPQGESRQVIHKVREETHSFVHPSDIIGREYDKEKLIQLLHSSTDGGKISVIPLVGIGGLGKTALAKLVYNDHRVVESFPLRMWVCVSDVFDVKRLLFKILKAASNGSRVQNEKLDDFDMENLQKSLKEKLDDVKFFLVLDDVWNQDPMKWEKLMDFLKANVNGSKIMVTTRSNQVAKIVGTVPPHDLLGLPFDECMNLFIRCAFKEEQHKHYPNLVNIGRSIVKKCGGVPLAVKTLASLLFTNTDENDWNSIERSDLWKLEQGEEGILPALRISYDHLPFYLKRCFAYCSFFPKDYKYNDVELIAFWMAHGLLHSKNDNEQLEDVGSHCVKELCSRSFFQDFEDHGISLTFKIHDLMHDLATSLIQNECAMITSTTQVIPKGVRHLFFEYGNLPFEDCDRILRGLDRVQTIACLNEREGLDSESIIQLCLSRFQYLRYLRLRDSKIEKLPKEIGRSRHLRFLDLRESNITRLPKSVYKLHSLQSLVLGGCHKLEELPSDIRYLVSLRCLSLTTKQKCLPKNGIGCLKSLLFLVIWDCENLETLFDDMKGLTSLRTLLIIKCPRLICLPQGAKHLTALDTLWIYDCDNLDLEMEQGNDNQEDFTAFHLQKLIIGYLPKLMDFPRWLLQGTTNSLKLLSIEGCDNLKQLPACISNMTSLRQLKINYCGELSEKCEHETGEDWLKIAHIPKIVIDDEIIQSLS